jgi:hypothetical protein
MKIITKLIAMLVISPCAYSIASEKNTSFSELQDAPQEIYADPFLEDRSTINYIPIEQDLDASEKLVEKGLKILADLKGEAPSINSPIDTTQNFMNKNKHD